MTVEFRYCGCCFMLEFYQIKDEPPSSHTVHQITVVENTNDIFIGRYSNVQFQFRAVQNCNPVFGWYPDLISRITVLGWKEALAGQNHERAGDMQVAAFCAVLLQTTIGF